MGSEEEERSLIEDELILIQHESNGLYTKDGSVDIHGKPVLKSSTGNWRASMFILGTECGQNLAFNGVSRNLVLYLTSKLHEGNVSAARNVTTWIGACHLTPVVGAVLADAYWGRYWTTVVFSTIYFIGMCMLTLFASVPALTATECVGLSCPSATPTHRGIFFLALYMIALGNGGIMPCISSFGANQFDETDPKERVKKGSFFNWFYFSSNIGILVSSSLIVWIQENSGWGLGFGIPSLFMGIAIASFLLGTRLYRSQRPRGSPIVRMCQVVVASFRKRKFKVPEDSTLLYETSDKYSANEGSRKLEHTDELKCLDRAAILLDDDVQIGNFNPWKLCTVTQVEEMKILIRMFPIWASVIMYVVVYVQSMTTFVEQGLVMDRTVGSFKIPAATLSIFFVVGGIIWVPIYDRILIPIARNFTGEERGFSTLQRMGIGLFFSILSMAAAALVEIRRLELARELGLINKDQVVPLDIFWQVPQYFLLASASLFTYVGKIEFFYDQSPDTMRSFCSALMLLIICTGDYLSSFIFTIVTAITTADGKTGWIPDNLNKGHLDYFFWLLAGLSSLNVLVYVFCAKTTSKRKLLCENPMLGVWKTNRCP